MDKQEAIIIAQEFYRRNSRAPQGQVLRVFDAGEDLVDRENDKDQRMVEFMRKRWGKCIIVWFGDPTRSDLETGIRVEKATGEASVVIAD